MLAGEVISEMNGWSQLKKFDGNEWCRSFWGKPFLGKVLSEGRIKATIFDPMESHATRLILVPSQSPSASWAASDSMSLMPKL